MKKYYLILLLLAPLFTIAQSNYKKGFIVSLKGDTVHGYIDYKAWPQNPRDINFKADLKDDKKSLTVNDINAFGVDGVEYYNRYIVNISQYGADLSTASVGIDNTAITDTVFLKLMQWGKNATLYSYRDDLKTRFYIKGNLEAVPEELIYKVYLNDNNLVTQNLYTGQLEQLADTYKTNTPALKNEIKRSRYAEDDLISITAQINGDDAKQIKNTIARNSKARFYFGAAYTVNTLQYVSHATSTVYTYSDFNPFANASPAKSNSPKLTFGGDAAFGRIELRAELALSFNDYTITNTEINPYTPIRVSTQHLKQGTVSVTPQVIYNIYNTDKFKLFIDGGISYNLSAYPTNMYTTLYASSYSGQSFPVLNKTWFSFPLKAGILLNKKIELYGSYSSAMGLSEYIAFNAKITTYQGGINYFFK